MASERKVRTEKRGNRDAKLARKRAVKTRIRLRKAEDQRELLKTTES